MLGRYRYGTSAGHGLDGLGLDESPTGHEVGLGETSARHGLGGG
jgi:hypothetical protein